MKYHWKISTKRKFYHVNFSFEFYLVMLCPLTRVPMYTAGLIIIWRREV